LVATATMMRSTNCRLRLIRSSCPRVIGVEAAGIHGGSWHRESGIGWGIGAVRTRHYRTDDYGTDDSRTPDLGVIEGDRRRTIPPCVTVGQLLLRFVLDPDQPRERHGAPPVRDRGREAVPVRRIRERHVVGAWLEPVDEPHGIASMNRERVTRAEELRVVPDGADAGGADLDEVGRRGAARQGLEDLTRRSPQRGRAPARPRDDGLTMLIQASRTAIGGRTDAGVGGRANATTPPAPGDDAHA
jgi:hypothetical protein